MAIMFGEELHPDRVISVEKLYEIMNKYEIPYRFFAQHEVEGNAFAVVRCKDCKHWAYTANGAGDCRNPRFTIPDTVDPTMYAHEFCALGERETNDKT